MRIVNDILNVNRQINGSVSPDLPVINAIKLMADMQVDVLPVFDDEKFVGILLEKDYIPQLVLSGKSPDTTLVKEIMRQNYINSNPTQSIEDCLDEMTRMQVLHIPVLSNGTFVGFVSINDLLAALLSEQKDYIYRLENYVLGTGFNQ